MVEVDKTEDVNKQAVSSNIGTVLSGLVDETREMEIVPSSEVFGRTMTPEEVREKEILRLETQVHEQYQIIHQQQDKINKLSQTWTQKLKNMIGPLV